MTTGRGSSYLSICRRDSKPPEEAFERFDAKHSALSFQKTFVSSLESILDTHPHVPDYIYESYNESLIDAYQWKQLVPRERWERAQLDASEEDHRDETNDRTILQRTDDSQVQETYHTPPTPEVVESNKQVANQSSSTT